jgi:zinc protease
MTAYLQVAYHGPAAGDPDFYPMLIVSTILTGASGMNLFTPSPPNRSSRLYMALVETELAASASGSLWPMLDPHLYSLLVMVRAGRTLEEVETALDTEIERIRQEPILKEELETAVKQTQAQFAYATESVTNQGYGIGFSAVVADTDWFETFLDKLATVTINDIQRVAQAYLPRRNRTTGHYVPEDRASAEVLP